MYEIKKLKPEVIERLKKHHQLKAMLMMLFDNTSYTIDRWVGENNVMLTTHSSLNIIRMKLGYDSNEQLLELPHPNGSQIENAMLDNSCAEKRG